MSVLLTLLVAFWFVVAIVQSLRVMWLRWQVKAWRAVAEGFQDVATKQDALLSKPQERTERVPFVWDGSQQDKVN